jgi:hypothetical protein
MIVRNHADATPGNLLEAAKLRRVATHSSKAEDLRAQTQRRHAAALEAWDPSDKPRWLDEKTYSKKDSASPCQAHGFGHIVGARHLRALRNRYSREQETTAPTALVSARADRLRFAGLVKPGLSSPRPIQRASPSANRW